MKEPLYKKIGHGIIWCIHQIINFAILILILLDVCVWAVFHSG